MEIGTILVAAVVIAIVWKVLTGLIKFAMTGAVVLGALWFLSQGAIA
ncbi:MAG: hypothetical protein R3D89_09160 [Sphingomonadaceae bacterium]